MHSHYIDAQWIEGAGDVLVSHDPSTGEAVWTGRAATASEVDAACNAARRAFRHWSPLPVEDRMAICNRFRDLLKEQASALAQLISLEVGKPAWEARTEVASMANKVDISVQAYHARTGAARSSGADGEAVLRHRPHGVFGVFGPYNFPGHLPNGHIVPALIAGNTIVFKPSEHAPQTAEKTVKLWIESGLPQGVLNLVNGGKETGQALAAHPQLDGVLFTGSYRTGVSLHRQFAGHPGKMLALELGGNNPLVVWNPGDVDAAVHHTILSAFISAGQRCTCARRLIVEESAEGRRFVDRLTEVTREIRIGRYDQMPEPFMGPVVSAQAAADLIQVQDDLIARGATMLLPMRRLKENSGFASPGIIDITGVNHVPDEEWFGPLLQVQRVPDFESAIRTANATEYGLAAGLLSQEKVLWDRFITDIRAGIVNWNRPTTGAAGTAPFGGIGRSGNYRPSAYYAADYCAYPMASIESAGLEMPKQLLPGLMF